MTRPIRQRVRPSPTIRVGVLGLFAAFLLVLPLILAPRAEAFIYWARCEIACLDGGMIGRANLDGSDADRSFITAAAGPSAVAVGASHVYWTGLDSIGHANLDGTGVNPSFITSGHALGVAVSTSHVYWTSANSIGRANLDGSGANPSFITGAGFLPHGVAVDARHIYWAIQPLGEDLQGSIGRAKLNGTGVDPSFIAHAGFSPLGIAVDAGHIYWSHTSTAIARAKLDGTHVAERFIRPHRSFPYGLAVDANHVYWADLLFGSIGRANLDGTHVDERFITGAGIPTGVAVNTLPDTRLAGRATAATTQGQSGKQIVVRVKLKANEQLTAEASGKVKVNPTYKLRPKKVQVAAGKTKTLRLKPKKKAARKIATALKRGEKANARLTVRLTDWAGNTESEKLRVRLKR